MNAATRDLLRDTSSSLSWAQVVVRSVVDVMSLASNQGTLEALVSATVVSEIALLKVAGDLEDAECDLNTEYRGTRANRAARSA